MEQGRKTRESLPMHWLGDSLGQNIDGMFPMVETRNDIGDNQEYLAKYSRIVIVNIRIALLASRNVQVEGHRRMKTLRLFKTREDAECCTIVSAITPCRTGNG
jgi:hypothetical protein